jgi:hypothetical protein
MTMRMFAIALASALPMGWAVACAGQEVAAQASPPAPPPARPSPEPPRLAPAEFEAERSRLKGEINRLEKDGTQAVDLNRDRLRLAIVLLNEAIATLHRPGSGLDDFDRATEYITEADSYIASVDSGVFNEEDRRIHADLQVLSRRALGEQVSYLRRLLPLVPPRPLPPEGPVAPPQLPPEGPVAPPEPPVVIGPVCPAPPVCQTIPVTTRRRGLFRWFQAR